MGRELIAGTRVLKLGHVRAKKEGKMKRTDDGMRAPVFMPKWTGPWEVTYRGSVAGVVESC